MSFNGGNQAETNHMPGAFPSEDEITRTEQSSHNSQNNTLAGSKTTTGGGNVDDKTKDFLEQREAAHTAGGWQADKHIPGLEQNDNRPEPISSQLEHENLSQARTRDDLETSTSAGSRTADAFGAGQETSNTHTTGGPQDESSIGSNLATMATAVGLAAKDAFIAAKDSAAPAANAATEQAKSLAGYTQEKTAPAANYTADQAKNAAAYTKNSVTSDAPSGDRETVPTDTALQTAGSAAIYAKDTAYSAANTAQSYAPSVLGEPSNKGSNNRENASETSASQVGEPRGIIRLQQPAGDSSQFENNMLGGIHTQQTKKPQTTLASHVKNLEEQLSPESMTPGVVTVMGTEQDRSFPLDATDHVVST